MACQKKNKKKHHHVRAEIARIATFVSICSRCSLPPPPFPSSPVTFPRGLKTSAGPTKHCCVQHYYYYYACPAWQPKQEKERKRKTFCFFFLFFFFFFETLDGAAVIPSPACIWVKREEVPRADSLNPWASQRNVLELPSDDSFVIILRTYCTTNVLRTELLRSQWRAKKNLSNRGEKKATK